MATLDLRPDAVVDDPDGEASRAVVAVPQDQIPEPHTYSRNAQIRELLKLNEPVFVADWYPRPALSYQTHLNSNLHRYYGKTGKRVRTRRGEWQGVMGTFIWLEDRK